MEKFGYDLFLKLARLAFREIVNTYPYVYTWVKYRFRPIPNERKPNKRMGKMIKYRPFYSPRG